MRRSTIAMMICTLACISMGALVPYKVSDIQNAIALSQESSFESPDVDIRLILSNSLLEDLETYVSNDSIIDVDSGMKMTESEVLDDLQSFLEEIHGIGFMSGIEIDDELDISMNPALCYSNSTGRSTFIWDCRLMAFDKSMAFDAVVEDSTGKIISVSARNEDERSEQEMKLASKDSRKYDEKIDSVADFMSNYLGTTLLEYDGKSLLDLSAADSVAASSSLDGENDQVDEFDKQTISYYEGDGTVISEQLLRVEDSDVLYRISCSFSSNPNSFDDTMIYWDIVPFAKP